MTCHKQQFDKKGCKTILNERKIKGKKWSREVRYYECPICGWWHLTSKDEWEEPIKLELRQLQYAEKWKTLQG